MTGKSHVLVGKSRILGSMALSYAPGFFLPFIIAAASPKDQSDRILFAISCIVTCGSIVGIAVENAWAASYANAIARGETLGRREFQFHIAKISAVGALATCVILPVFVLPTTVFGGVDPQFTTLILIAAPFPMLTGAACMAGGIMNAQGKIPLSLSLQAIRGALSLLAAFGLFLNLPAWLLMATLPLGEALRAVLGLALVGPAQQKDVLEVARWTGAPKARALISHMAGMGVLGSSPVIDRTFLSMAEAGAVTVYEMSDRVFFAANQIASNIFVLPRVAVIGARLSSEDPSVVLRSELGRAGKSASALAVSGTVVMVGVCLFAVPSLKSVLPWMLVQLLSLPVAVAGVVCTRISIATGNSRLIPYAATTGMVVNVAADAAGFFVLGSFGIVLSTLLVRLVMFLAMLTMLARNFGMRGAHVSKCDATFESEVVRRGRVIHVGDHPSGRGGISSVIRNHLSRDAAVVGYEPVAIATHVPGAHWRKRLSVYLTALRHLFSLRKELRSSVVHVHLSRGGSLVREGSIIYIMRIFGARKVVVTIHGSSVLDAGRVSRALYRVAIWPATKVHVLSLLHKSHLSLRSGRCVVIANDVALPPQMPMQKSRKKEVVFFGQISHRKGVDLLVDSWRRIETRDWQLTLYGHCDESSKSLVEDLPVGARYGGELGHDKVLTRLLESSVVVLPSRAEALPMVLCEAMAAGCSIVASNVGAVRELFPGDLAVQVVRTGSVGAITHALRLLMGDLELRQALGQMNRQHAAAKFSAKEISSVWASVYEPDSV
jgi:glycosyltransferase involved in cell wall biosynthesis